MICIDINLLSYWYIKSMTTKVSDIVSGKETQKWLELWLNQFPESNHQLDIERLDYFIIALFRYISNYIRSHLEKYLKEDKKWEKNQIELILNRIDIGLKILEARSTFVGAYFNDKSNDD